MRGEVEVQVTARGEVDGGQRVGVGAEEKRVQARGSQYM